MERQPDAEALTRAFGHYYSTGNGKCERDGGATWR
jgi:hypothetical protein